MKYGTLLISAITAGVINAGSTFLESVASGHPSEWFPWICAAGFLISASQDARSQLQMPPLNSK